MKQKAGYKQAVNLMVFIMIPQLICNYISYGMSKTGSSYWLNFTLCTLLAFVMFLPLKYSFMSKNNISKKNSFESIISIIYLINIFFLALYNLQSCTIAISSLIVPTLKTDVVVFLPVISAIICSNLGIEAISRTAYFIMFICVGIIFLICSVSFRGFDTENLYPILGNSFKDTFLNFASAGIYAPLLIVYVLRDSVCLPDKSFNILKKSLLYVYIIGLVIVILCVLSVPYPMINYYSFSLGAIFSIAKSSVFFHRFELMLIFLIITLTTISLSVVISLFAKKLSDLTDSHDERPFCLITGMLLFYFCILNNPYIARYIYYVSFALLYILLFIKSTAIYLKQKTKRDNN